MITDDGRTVSGLKAPPWSAAFVRSRWEPLSAFIYHNSLYRFMQVAGGKIGAEWPDPIGGI